MGKAAKPIGRVGLAGATYVSSSAGAEGELPPTPLPPSPPTPPPIPSAAWVREESRNAILPRLTGLPAARMPYFAAENVPPGVYALNPDRWTAGIDLTGLVAAHDQGGGVWSHAQGGCLVSPLHVVVAHHFATTGAVRFVAEDGSVVERAVASVVPLWNSAGGVEGDAALATLASPVPDSIAPVGIFARSFTYPVIGNETIGSPFAPFGQVGYDKGFGLWIGQNSEIVPCQVYGDSGLSGAGPSWDLPELDGWAASAVGGDSGSVVVVILGGVPVLWTCLYQPTIGPPYFTNPALRARLADAVLPYTLDYFAGP